MQNKKIKNATPLEYEGIKFKSRLEVMAYKTLLQEGFNPEYESETYILWGGFKPTVPFYDKDLKTGTLRLNNKKIIDLKYTPDFTFKYKDYLVIIEIKGMENDTFYIKKKLFRSYLEDMVTKYNQKSIFFEIFNKRQLLEAINIIRNL